MQMNFAQKGAYIVLISYQWLNDGLPKNDSYIRNLLGGTPKWKQLWAGVKHKFVEIDGRLYNKRLYKERQKQIEHRKQASEAGKKGAEKRWQSHSNPIDSPMAKNSFSSSTSSSTTTSNNTPHTPHRELRVVDAQLNAKGTKQIYEELYMLLAPKKEVERWDNTGRMFNQIVLSDLRNYLGALGNDFETAKNYAKVRKNKAERGEPVSNISNFCRKDWINYAEDNKGDIIDKLKAQQR
jgi:uncharacterized protein YdaU (DUF1376 family)